MRFFTLAALIMAAGAGLAAPPGAVGVTAADAPDDAGGVVLLTWPASPWEQTKKLKQYEVYRREVGKGEYEKVAEALPGECSYVDQDAPRGVTFQYRVMAVPEAGAPVPLGEATAASSAQWFYKNRVNVLLGVILVNVIFIIFIIAAKRGANLFVRKIAGLDAVEEAIGRATEMGKPILFVSGLSDASDISTIAAMTILARVAKKTAEYETPLIVPCYDPIVMMVEKEMVKEAYTEAGKPDAFDEDSVFFVTQSQFGYVAAVDGIMVREKPATNIYMGAFFAESLILAETGAATGAIQIAGTDRVTQLPFFITACDYTLMGEELYAATAYLSRNPLFLGSLKGQDWAKAVIMACIIIGTFLLIIDTDLGMKFASWFQAAAEATG